MKSVSSVIIFLLLYLNLFANEDIRIISSSASSITFEYTPKYLPISYHELNGVKYTDISFDRAVGFSEESIGKIKLPYRNIPVGVSSEFGNTIQIITTQHSVIKGKVAPLIGYEKLNSDQIGKADKEFINKELVRFGDFGQSRDLAMQTILVSPIQYDPNKKEITLYNKIVIRVNFGKSDEKDSEIKDKYVKDNVINYKVAKNWGRESKKLRKTVTNSVLGEGTWYRFEAPEEGIYKITRSELESLGIDASTVDPRKIKIYNNGGKPLPERVSTPSPTDLVENAIMVIGEEDGVLNANDQIIFYGRGTDFWEFSTSQNKVVRHHHPYSKKNYYWITSGGSNGKRMNAKSSLTGDVDIIQTSTIAFKSLDDDKINIGRSGRDYWGDDFSQTTNSRTYINDLSGRISSEPIKYKFRFANATSQSFPVRIYENNNQIYSGSLLGYSSSDEYQWGRENKRSAQYSGILPENRSALKIVITASSAESKAYIDYYEMEYKRDLNPVDDEILFFAEAKRSDIEYQLTFTHANEVKIFNVSEGANVEVISNPEISGGYINFRDAVEDDYLTKYIALTTSKYKTITNIEKVENSNITGFSSGVEYVIITDKKFDDQASRLAEYRQNESPNPLTAKVFYMDEILNEFSGGSLDPTAIRNFLKYAYENWQVKPFFVLLFGDGDYDYFDTEGYSKNFIPTYQTVESLDEINSHPMDDYYSRIIGDDSSADLAVGRLTIQSEDDAEIVVDKIIAYESVESGLWKNLVTLIADDGLTAKGNDGALHTNQSERLVSERIPKFMDLKKIYLAAYPTIQTGFGRRKPEVNEALITAINQGTLILNYIGHGNPGVWAHEHIFTQTGTIPSLKNDEYFFMTAATCDFGLYDDPSSKSSTEDMLLLENRGMIGAFTSSRVVYAHQNEAINKEFYLHLLGGSHEKMINTTIGEAFYKTKKTRVSTNDKKFHLYGDPALRLNIPKIPSSIENVNGNDLSSPVQLSALSDVSINGVVRNYDNSINTTYNGEAIVTVYDSERRKPLPELGTNYNMIEPGGVIFRGRASINNGTYSANFTVPKDISYENNKGKIVVYLDDSNHDGVGYTDQITIGGTDTSAVDDGNGPEIEIYFDESESSNAGLVNEDFTLVVDLADETGLNTTGTGIGHKLEGVIDDDKSKAVDFTNYFIGDLDAAGKSGQVKYKVTDAALGDHKIAVKAWDVFNNPSQQESYFTVVNSGEIVLKDVVNYPNPFSSNTTFLFQHNINEPIDVTVKVYTIAGRLIKVIDEYSITDKFVKIDWDGRDQDGSQIANGTYLYKVIVKSIDGKSNQNVLGKLAVYR
ncbi:MAG: type IX secretion system sortase PorU [Bacteroidota bacterium]